MSIYNLMNIVIIFRKSIKKLSKSCEFLCYFKQNVRNNLLTDAINPSFFSNFAVKFYI